MFGSFFFALLHFRILELSRIIMTLNGSYPYLHFLAITCGHPGNPANGVTHGTQFNLNDMVRFTCNTGYLLQGSINSRCQSNGQWSNSLPTCKGKSSNYQAVLFKLSKFWHKKMVYWRWIYSFFLAVVNCSDPAHVENSIRRVQLNITQRFSYGSSVSYECNAGYYLLGSDVLTCQGDGSWDKSLPKCLCKWRWCF